ncbi:hypothetical protein Tco_0994844 [Tanacetum coccineum]
MKFAHNNVLKSQCKTGTDDEYHLQQIENFMNNQVVWESRQPDILRQPTQVFQVCARDPNAPTRYLYNKDLFYLRNGNTEARKYVLSLHKIHATSFPEDDLEEFKTRSDPYEFFSNKNIIDIVRVKHHEVYGHEQIDEVCMKRNDDKYYTFAESDFKSLNKNDIEDMYYICLRERDNSQLIALRKALIIFIRSCVIWERVHDLQLGIESYQIKIILLL